MKKLTTTLFACCVVASAYFAGCSSEAPEEQTDDNLVDCGGVNNQVGGGKLTPFKDTTGQVVGLTDKKGRVLRDPVAKLVLASPGTTANKCPSTLNDIVDKLNKTTDANCTQKARFVSETAQITGTATNYRAVLTRQCADNRRNENEMFISVFGIPANASPLPQDVEMIGQERDDKNAPTGVFNYYARENGAWTYFGSSLDIAQAGYSETPDGATVSNANFRCSGCHASGGLTMKELASPWVHWEGDTTTPGAQDLVTKNPVVTGTKGTGIDMESLVRSGNGAWNNTRLGLLQKNLKELLRPLFCTMEMNIRSSNRQGTGDLSVPPQLFVDPLVGFTTVTIDGDSYLKALLAAKSGITSNGVILTSNRKLDTFFNFAFPEPAGITNDYVKKLQSAGIVDDDLTKDILAVDFTRPVFSPTRCGLLTNVPATDASALKAADIKAALVKAFTGKTQKGAAELLASLQNTNDAATRATALSAFTAACQARTKDPVDKLQFANDVVAFASHVRKAAGRTRNKLGAGIIEFEQTFPTDSLAETKKAFDPVTCKLTLD